MSGWEDRMAERRSKNTQTVLAKLQHEQWLRDRDAADWREYQQKIIAARADIARRMTLEKAVEYLQPDDRYACACHGPVYCCVDWYQQAAAVVRAAHIAVKQMAELEERFRDDQGGRGLD